MSLELRSSDSFKYMVSLNIVIGNLNWEITLESFWQYTSRAIKTRQTIWTIPWNWFKGNIADERGRGKATYQRYTILY